MNGQRRPLRLLSNPLNRLLDRLTPAPPPGSERPIRSTHRLVLDSVRFSSSLGGELSAITRAAPAYFGELVATQAYPRIMSYRRLRGDPSSGRLSSLKRSNKDWVFRKSFDPQNWVLVFLHGYIDNTGADRAIHRLARLGYTVYLVRYPFLKSVRELSRNLEDLLLVIQRREKGKALVPIGHSLGGFVWDDLLLRKPEVVDRHKMPLYIPMGSPHMGTIAAHLGPGQSAKDMQPGSALIQSHKGLSFPEHLEVYPFVSRFDLLTLPVETSLWSGGINYIFSETGHIAQVTDQHVVTAIEEIFATDPEVLRARAHHRPFHPTNLTQALSKLPKGVQDKLHLRDLIEAVVGSAGATPKFMLRIVQRELRSGTFPILRRA